MAKTAKQIIDRAASKIGVKRAGVDLSEDEYDSFISEMNNTMFGYAVDGLNFGYSEVSSTSDEVTIPFWSYGFIENILALRMAVDFNAPIPPGLPAIIEKEIETAETALVRVPVVSYPDILPTGSGDNGFFSQSKYFEDATKLDIEDLNGSTIRDQEDDPIQKYK